ncbi:MAG: RNase adapter RapZ [Oscillospiraceae bacterium]|nr:RNase adapter RapZ [Oscillospiraceae bacterium]
MEITIVSGLSGAGKSRVVKVLEDMDFYCVDNMPVSMMPKFAELCLAAHGRYERVALVTDVRALENINELFYTLDEIREIGCTYEILFIEAEVETIVRRYKETRHRHPLETQGRSLEETVKTEIELLMPVRERAAEVIDTTGLTLNKLQRRLFKRYMDGQEYKALSVNVKSFGFKHGLPIEADLLFDVRFMPNPFYIPELREKTGLDGIVKDYVFSLEQSNVFFSKLCDLLDYLLPHYIEEGKRYLVICIGCTGGKHRAPAIAQALAEYLGEQGYPVDCIHRDIERE